MVTHFAEDEGWNILLNPVIIDLVEEILEAKVKGEGTVEEVSEVTMHQVITEGNVASAFSVVGHCGIKGRGVKRAQTKM